MAKEETAEQKLLKMIEATSGAGASGVKKEGKKSFLNINWSEINIVQAANNLLCVVIVILSLCLGNEIVMGRNSLINDIQAPIIDQKVSRRQNNLQGLIPSVPKLAFYLKGVLNRNLFQPFDDEGRKNDVAVSDKNRHIVRKTSSFKLVGVSWLDRVETASVMIEDMEKKQTYFLEQGDTIGDVYVKTIYADSVQLGYENEEIIIQYDNSK